MTKCDILIIGAGPAGLSAASYSARAGYNTIILDGMGAGGQSMFIDKIENYPGVQEISGYELAERFEKQCDEFGVQLEYANVTAIEKNNAGFIAKTDGGEFESKALIVATGASHRHLGVEGEEEYKGRGVSYCATCDGPFFKGKSVIVVGGGDTALTDAIYLSKLCKDVTVIHRRDEFRAQKILQDRIKNIENIKTIMSNNIKTINGDGNKVTSVTLLDGSELKTDGIFVLVGTIPNSNLVSTLSETKNGYIITNDKMETSCPGLFASGDVRNTPFRQVVTAAGDGAMAAHSADEYIQNL